MTGPATAPRTATAFRAIGAQMGPQVQEILAAPRPAECVPA